MKNLRSAHAPALELVADAEPEADGVEEAAAAPVGADDDELAAVAVRASEGGELDSATEDALRQWLARRMGAYFKAGRARIIFTDNLHTMLSIKRGQGVFTLRMHRMFAAAPSPVLRAVVRYAETQDREAAALLRRYIDGNEHLIRPAERTRTQVLDTQGAHYNLQELLDDLNERYFAGEIEAKITWGPRTRRRPGRESIKLGSYSIEEQLIRIHPVLDAVDVPRFFVEWIIYHEMLHERHPIRVQAGRRCFHPPAFLAEEMLFEDFDRASRWERHNAHRLLRF